MKKYSIRIVSHSSLNIEANSKEEAIKKAGEILGTLSEHPERFPENVSLDLLHDLGSGWLLDDEDANEEIKDEVLPFHS